MLLAHFQRASILVEPGERVARGQPLGRCGNLGNTDCPHPHLHIQDSPVLDSGAGQNPVFSSMKVVLDGESFAGVTWPLIRGLFVEAP